MKKPDAQVIEREDAPRLWTLSQVAKFLGVCPRTISRRVDEGHLAPPIKVGRSSRWFRSDLDCYLQKLEQLRSFKGGQAQ